MSQSLGALLEALRSRRPLIHCITNPISINDCANLILAAGGRPIMAEHPGEVAEITATAAALAVNLGNITDVRMESMVLAGQAAREAGVPMVLDCVGVGCSTLRRRYAQDYLAEIQPQVAKGNLSELLCLSGARQGMSGVDADGSDRLEGQTLSALRAGLGAGGRGVCPRRAALGDPQRPQHDEPTYRYGVHAQRAHRRLFGGRGAGGGGGGRCRHAGYLRRAGSPRGPWTGKSARRSAGRNIQLREFCDFLQFG